MLKNSIFAGLAAGIFGTIISVAYIYVFKYSPLEADFSEKASISYLLQMNMAIGMVNCIVYFGISKLFKKENIAAFINGFLLSGVAISLSLLLMFTVENITFKNENAQSFSEFYFFIIAPIPFFSVLSWFTFKPLFIKETTK
jgi:hypothetical protein